MKGSGRVLYSPHHIFCLEAKMGRRQNGMQTGQCRPLRVFFLLLSKIAPKKKDQSKT